MPLQRTIYVYIVLTIALDTLFFYAIVKRKCGELKGIETKSVTLWITQRYGRTSATLFVTTLFKYPPLPPETCYVKYAMDFEVYQLCKKDDSSR